MSALKNVYFSFPRELEHANVMTDAYKAMADAFHHHEYHMLRPDYDERGVNQNCAILSGDANGLDAQNPKLYSNKVDAVCILPLVNGAITPATKQEVDRLKQAYPEIEISVIDRQKMKVKAIDYNHLPDIITQDDLYQYRSDGNHLAPKGQQGRA